MSQWDNVNMTITHPYSTLPCNRRMQQNICGINLNKEKFKIVWIIAKSVGTKYEMPNRLGRKFVTNPLPIFRSVFCRMSEVICMFESVELISP